MRKLFILSVLLSLFALSFAGTASGQLIFECSSSGYAMAFVVILSSFSESGAVGYTMSYAASGWTYSVEADFSDDVDYFAIAAVPVGMSVLPGYPMGQYPNNPFHTVGGNASEINIIMDDTVDVNIDVDVIGATYGNIFVNVWDITSSLFDPTAHPVLEDTAVPLPNEGVNTISIASGLKALQFFKDINGNLLWDGDEPYVYYYNEDLDTNVFVAGGGISRTVFATLDLSRVDEYKNLTNASVRLSPNPSNSVVTVEMQLPRGQHELIVTDISGRTVLRSGVSSGIILWDTEDLPTGIYTVRVMSRDGLSVSANQCLIK